MPEISALDFSSPFLGRMDIWNLPNSRIEKSLYCNSGSMYVNDNQGLARYNCTLPPTTQATTSATADDRSPSALQRASLPFHSLLCVQISCAASRFGGGRYFLYANRTVPWNRPPPTGFWGRTVLETSTGNRLGFHPMAQVMGASSVYGDSVSTR